MWVGRAYMSRIPMRFVQFRPAGPPPKSWKNIIPERANRSRRRQVPVAGEELRGTGAGGPANGSVIGGCAHRKRFRLLGCMYIYVCVGNELWAVGQFWGLYFVGALLTHRRRRQGWPGGRARSCGTWWKEELKLIVIVCGSEGTGKSSGLKE